MQLRNQLFKFLLTFPKLVLFCMRMNQNRNPDKYFFVKWIKQGDLIVDAGANIGLYSSLFSNIVKTSGFVHSFEPIKNTFQSLRNHINADSRYKNYQLNNLGLGDKIERKVMYIPDEISGHASLKRHDIAWKAKETTQHQVQVTTLDSYCERHKLKKLNFLKIDIEGAEYFALNGGINTITKFKPILHMEVNSQLMLNFNKTPIELVTLLESMGYFRIYYYDDKPWDLVSFKSLIKKMRNDDFCTTLIAFS
jgi:FkbM family methyltransferase